MRRRIVVLTVTIFAFAAVAGIARATPICEFTPCVYLPVILSSVPPPPPPMSTLVIQPSEIQSGYAVIESHEATNADAAKTYKNAKQALRDFAAQGRETSWFITYFSTAYITSDAIGIGNQVYRYATPAGAIIGQAYTLAETRRDHPEYRPVDITLPCCSTVAIDRTFVDGGNSYEQVIISVQVGRYVTETQVLWARISTISVEKIIAYAQTSANHLLVTPQAAQSNNAFYSIQPPGAVPPSVELLRAAMTPR